MTAFDTEHLREFPQISYKAFSYPGDEEALEGVKRIPGVNKLFHWIIDNLLEEFIHLDQLYNNVRVNTNSHPTLHGIVADGCRVLDCPMPEVFVKYSPVFNAGTSGVDRIFIRFNSYLIEDFTEEEIAFIAGHEIGHIKAGHVLYHTVADFVVKFLPVLQTFIPFNIGMLYQPMLLALYEWYRRAEFTSDRAGLLYVQDLDVALTTLSKLAGRTNKYREEFDMDVMLKQSAEVQESDKKLVKLLLFIDNMANSHPYPAVRVAKLKEWVDSGDYTRVLAGEYPRDTLGEHELGMRVKCRGCGAKINSKLQFCPECGQPTDPEARRVMLGKCRHCGLPFTEHTKYCPGCGTPTGWKMDDGDD